MGSSRVGIGLRVTKNYNLKMYFDLLLFFFHIRLQITKPDQQFILRQLLHL